MIYITRKEIADAVINGYDCALGSHVQQLYNCKAWVFMNDNFDFTILQSYTTIVAAFQRSTGIIWVFGFYSKTTAQHVAKFKKWIQYKYQTGWNYPIIVRLYNDSRTSKRVARKNIEDDFASVIASALNQR